MLNRRAELLADVENQTSRSASAEGHQDFQGLICPVFRSNLKQAFRIQGPKTHSPPVSADVLTQCINVLSEEPGFPQG